MPIMLPNIIVANDLIVIPINRNVEIVNITSFIRTLLTGTFNANIKKKDGTTVSSISRNSSGLNVETASVTQILQGDELHINITGLPLTINDVTITIEFK